MGKPKKKSADRDRLNDLVARQLGGDQGAAETETVPVTFLRTGDVVDVTLRRLTPSERRRSQHYAAYQPGPTGEFVYRLGIAAIRFGAIDPDGAHEFTSYEQVVAFQNAITDESWDALGAAMAKLRPADEPIGSAEDPEAGKGS